MPACGCAIRSALALVAIVGATVAEGQSPASTARFPKLRSRVRLTSLSNPERRVTGMLQEVSDDSIVVRPDRDSTSVALARSDVAQVEVRVREREAQNTATVLSVAGAIGGTAIYVNWCRQNREACRQDAWGDGYSRGHDCASDSSSHFTVPTLLILGGAAIGGAIGHGLVAPHWEVLGVPMRIGVVPLGSRGLVVGVSLAVGPRPEGVGR